MGVRCTYHSQVINQIKVSFIKSSNPMYLLGTNSISNKNFPSFPNLHGFLSQFVTRTSRIFPAEPRKVKDFKNHDGQNWFKFLTNF